MDVSIDKRQKKKAVCEALKNWKNDSLKEEMINRLYFHYVYEKNQMLAEDVKRELLKSEREAQKVKK